MKGSFYLYIRIILSFIIGLTLLSTSSCLPSDMFPQFKSTPEPRLQWITKWLNNPTCQPPCFESLYPGVTSTKEALITLQNNPDFAQVKDHPRITTNDLSTIEWSIVQGGVGTAYSDSQDLIMNQIRLEIPEGQNLTLEEIIKTYGPPSYVWLFGNGVNVVSQNVYLVYISQGILLELVYNSKDNKISMKSDLYVSVIDFFPPGLDGLRKIFPCCADLIPERLIKWDGYKDYP